MIKLTDAQVNEALERVESTLGVGNGVWDMVSPVEIFHAIEAEVLRINGRQPISIIQIAYQMQKDAIPLSAEWTPCVKLPVVVHVREQKPGESHISTREGITPVKPDDLIMRGVQGEEYPIGRELWEKTYRVLAHSITGKDNAS